MGNFDERRHMTAPESALLRGVLHSHQKRSGVHALIALARRLVVSSTSYGRLFEPIVNGDQPPALSRPNLARLRKRVCSVRSQ